MAAAGDIEELATLMEDYANHIKANLPQEQQAIIDALVMAQDTKKNRYPPRVIVARLRGAALQHGKQSLVLAAYMEALAGKIEQQRIQ